MTRLFKGIVLTLCIIALIFAAGCTTSQQSADITGISVSANPDKMDYYPGQSLNLAGLKIAANTTDGKSIDVTKECVITPKTYVFTEGDSTVPVTVSYTANGKTFTVKVNLRKVNEYHENQVITGDYDKSLAVQCNNGIFVGKKDGDVVMYRGIPFVAEQPTGNNRFKAPVAYDYSAPKDTTVREAYYFGKEAFQSYTPPEPPVSYPMGEDCLYLNVYTNAKDTSTKKPVMVWIHGGAFVCGGTPEPIYNLYNITKENPDVIFISIPYRLGLLGYIDLSNVSGYTDEYKDAANLGTLDQAEALHWIHENIAAFGGDPDNITIFGESAGGASVSIQPLLDKARPYVSKVIAQSGTPVFTRSKDLAVAVTDLTLEDLGITSMDELVKYDAQKLIDFGHVHGGLRTFPERDGVLIPKDPFAAYEQGVAKEIPIMQGFNKDEGGYWFHGKDAEGINLTQMFFEDRVNQWSNLMSDEDKKKVTEYIKIAPDYGYSPLVRFVDQLFFVAPAFRLSEAHSKAGGDVYQYYFTPESAETVVKSGHGMELSSVFGNYDPLNDRVMDPVFSKTVQKMWVQFAKTGNPSLSAEQSPTGKAIVWPKYTTGSKEVMQMDETNFHVESANTSELAKKYADWDGTYNLINYIGEKPADMMSITQLIAKLFPTDKQAA
ncbi:MAG TPA: carboxylesterase family protein [Methanocorpusculum sp.]|nr:carboxylesterase family protein [Methanocorpusculum sp.]